MASLKVNLLLRLLGEGAENKAGNILITKYFGITYYKCVCVCMCVCLLFRHAKGTRSIILSSTACPSLQHFSTLFHKQHVCFDFPYNFCTKYFSFQEELSEM
jgi:hypothetical protein